MFLLTAPIAKNSHILARIFFIFLKYILEQTWKSLIQNMDLSEKTEIKYLLRKTKFCTFSQISCSNFRL